MSGRTLICYGDSNTYGYDPRGFGGGRYEAKDRWCDILAAQTGCTVINLGENGRTLPEDSWDYMILDRCLRQHENADALIVMLGSNDVLLRFCPNVEEIGQKAEALLAYVRGKYPELKILLLAPPSVDIAEYAPLMRQLAKIYSGLAEKYGVGFANPQQWGLPLAYDGVHLTEAAHHIFAQKLKGHLGL